MSEVLVIGDVGLDRYIKTNVKRIAPEAPIPVCEFLEEEDVPGLAGNVAANIASLGGKPYLIAITGEDQARLDLEGALAEKGIAPDVLVSHNMRHTTTKTRFMHEHHLMYRIDRETSDQISPEFEEYLCNVIKMNIERIGPDVIVVSDYGKGMLTVKVMDTIKGYAYELGKPVIVDPKPIGENVNEKYSGSTLLTPNLAEAKQLVAVTGCKPEQDPKSLGEQICSLYAAWGVVITCGKDGAWFCQHGESFHVPVSASSVFDVCGAGDTVVAALAIKFRNATMQDALAFAVKAASVAVSRSGTYAVKIGDIV